MDFILTSTDNNTTTITINRPDVYNALNAAAKIEIIQAIRAANKDDHVRSIILTGSGKAFSSGQDLGDRNVQGEAVDLGHTLETEWNPLINAIRDSRKIIIGAINGVAAGAGLSVAMSCDLIVAKTGAKFVSGFSGLGLAPDAGSSFTFVKALGYQRTLEFFLLGKPLTAEQLLAAGMINQVSDEQGLAAQELAGHINAMAPLSLEVIKKNLQQAQELSFRESMERETQAQRFLGASQDYQEGLQAFFGKRKPSFKGI